MQVSFWACVSCAQCLPTCNDIGLAELHDSFAGDILGHSSALYLSHPHAMPTPAGAIYCVSGCNFTIAGIETLRDRSSNRREEAEKRRSLLFLSDRSFQLITSSFCIVIPTVYMYLVAA